MADSIAGFGRAHDVWQTYGRPVGGGVVPVADAVAEAATVAAKENGICTVHVIIIGRGDIVINAPRLGHNVATSGAVGRKVHYSKDRDVTHDFKRRNVEGNHLRIVGGIKTDHDVTELICGKQRVYE